MLRERLQKRAAAGDKRLEAAMAVAQTLFEAELDIDSSVSSTGGLIAKLAGEREKAELAAITTQDALELLGGSITSLIQSRRQMVEAHGKLDNIRRDMGLPTISWGDKFPIPPAQASAGATALRAVD